MNNPASASNRRRNYFIDKSFQSKFILKFCLLVIGAGLVTVGVLYYLSRQSMTVAFVNSRVVVKTTADFIMPVLVQTVVVVTVLVGLATMFVTLFVSHKIAGPLYRFRKAFEELGEGKYPEINLRQMDQLQALAKDFNAAIKKFKERQGK